MKIEYTRDFDRDVALFRGKIWLWLFYNYFCIMVQKFYTKNLKSFWPKMKAWRQFSRILISFWIGKINVTPSFLLKITWNFYCTVSCGSKILHKKIQVILSKNEGVTLIFLIQNEIKIRKNRRHAFIFGQIDLTFFV